MRRSHAAGLAIAALVAGLGMTARNPARQQPSNPPLPKVTVYKSPT
jgi:hypothetical protein